MKITVLTYGSRGDVQPFLALAQGLQSAGHAVTLAAPERFSDFVSSYAIPFVPLAGDPAEISLMINDAGSNVFRMMGSMRQYLVGIAPRVVRQVMEASSGADLLIHSFLFTTGAHTLAHHLGIPDVSIQTFPMFAPTGDYPNVAFPPLGMPGNYLSHWLATQVFWYGGNQGFRQMERLMPQDFPRKLLWPFRGPQPRPLLIACSPTVIPPSAGWGNNVHVTGYFFLDEGRYEPPESLSRFLEAGPPPVCVTFGSMLNRDSGRIHAVVKDALRLQGERGIFLTGWAGASDFSDDKNLLTLEAAPHGWLFPRCKAVIHHGGAGTTAAVLRAGIPGIILPHAADQPFWARRVHALGVSPAPIPLKKLDVDSLARGLKSAGDTAMIERAREIGGNIQAENGVADAIRLIMMERRD